MTPEQYPKGHPGLRRLVHIEQLAGHWTRLAEAEESYERLLAYLDETEPELGGAIRYGLWPPTNCPYNNHF